MTLKHKKKNVGRTVIRSTLEPRLIGIAYSHELETLRVGFSIGAFKILSKTCVDPIVKNVSKGAKSPAEVDAVRQAGNAILHIII